MSPFNPLVKLYFKVNALLLEPVVDLNSGLVLPLLLLLHPQLVKLLELF